MKAGTGWSAAALIAVAAVVGVNSLPGSKPPSSPTVAQGRVQNTASLAAKNAFERGPCAQLEGVIQNFLLTSPEGIAAPDSCFVNDARETKSDASGSRPESPGKSISGDAADDLRRKAGGLQFVIAILPDPLHTHFSLTFDRLAESIQQGAQDEGYYYDSSWQPWEKEEPSLTLLSDQDKEEDRSKAREEQPGILLFRKRPVRSGADRVRSGAQNTTPASTSAPAKDPAEDSARPYLNGLVVFVVGEEPTQGIHKRQFENAVSWISALQPQQDANEQPGPPVKILGPTFSGSLPSLAQLLSEENVFQAITQPRKNGAPQPVSIYSGGITSETLVHWFVERTRELGMARAKNPEEIRFRSFQGGGEQLIGRYRDYLESQGFELRHLAMVSEDETAFGGYGESTQSPTGGPCAPGPNGDAGPACLYYPRDISALRAAYQKQSIFGSSSEQQSTDTVKRTLNTDLADPEGKQHDSIRTYSANQTALSQEAVLLQIVSMLRAHESQYVVLRSSNPLDQLFLSHFFRLEYPEGRIVIEGSDLMLRRESGAATLSGIMTLTTYPLLPWGHHWMGVPGTLNFHSHRVFAQNLAEGTYVAARFLLDKADCGAGSSSSTTIPDESAFLPPTCGDLSINDYAPPFWASAQSNLDASRRPVTWLSVLGRDGFWPVAALTDTKPHTMPDWIAKPSLKDTPKKELPEPVRWSLRQLWKAGSSVVSLLHLTVWTLAFWLHSSAAAPEPPGWPPMPISMKLCLFAIFLWSVFHLHCCARPSLTVKPGHRAHFARMAGKSHTVLIVLGSMNVALVPVLLGWGYGAMSLAGEPVSHGWWYRAFLPLTWLTTGGAVCANAWVESDSYPRKSHRPAVSESFKEWRSRRARQIRELFDRCRVILRVSRKPLAYYAAGSAALYCIVDFSLGEDLTDANRIPTFWRSIHLTTGVSPLVPLLALAAGLYCWFWYSLQGLALFGADRPSLPTKERLRITLADGSVRDSLCMFSQDDAAEPIERLCQPFAIETCLTAGLLLPALLAAARLVEGGVGVRSLGSTDYSLLFGLGLALCASLMLANAWQLLRVWLRLRQLLVFLDLTPMRRTLKAMKGYSWGSVWKMGGNVLDVRYKLLSRQFEGLTHLSNLLFCPDLGLSALCRQIHATNIARGEFADWYSENWDNWKARDLSKLKDYQQSVAETAGIALTEALVPQWRSERKSLLLDSAGKDEGEGKDKDEGGTEALAELPAYVRVAEELVCLVYLGFVQNILGRMRTLVMVLLWLFVAVSASVASYPFDPRPALSGAMLLLFLLLGVVIVIVYSQMHRDATLSYVTDTTPGELGMEFWLKLLSFGAAPLFGLLATNFPELPGSLFSWLQPGMASMK